MPPVFQPFIACVGRLKGWFVGSGAAAATQSRTPVVGNVLFRTEPCEVLAAESAYQSISASPTQSYADKTSI